MTYQRSFLRSLPKWRDWKEYWTPSRTKYARRVRHQQNIPMTIDEACEFLKMKKSTMYYHIERGNIPATKSGKNYLLFKDELIQWAESGRRNGVAMTPEEQNAAFLKSNKRKPNSFRP